MAGCGHPEDALPPACVVTADLDPATRRGHSLCPRLEATRLPVRHMRAASTGPGAAPELNLPRPELVARRLCYTGPILDSVRSTRLAPTVRSGPCSVNEPVSCRSS